MEFYTCEILRQQVGRELAKQISSIAATCKEVPEI